MATYGQVEFSMKFYRLYRASRPLRKGRSSVSPSTESETVASHDAAVIYFTKYLSMLFQLAYLNELCRKCSGTAHACTNNRYMYQVLFYQAPEKDATMLKHSIWLSFTHVPVQANISCLCYIMVETTLLVAGDPWPRSYSLLVEESTSTSLVQRLPAYSPARNPLAAMAAHW